MMLFLRLSLVVLATLSCQSIVVGQCRYEIEYYPPIPDGGGLIHGGSNTGSICGSTVVGPSTRPWKMSNLESVILPLHPGFPEGLLEDINSEGDSIGRSIGPGFSQATIWSDSSPTLIPMPSGATGSFGYGINSEGTVVGYAGDFHFGKLFEAFRFSSETGYVNLNTILGVPFAIAEAINDSDTVVGSYWVDSSVMREIPFLIINGIPEFPDIPPGAEDVRLTSVANNNDAAGYLKVDDSEAQVQIRPVRYFAGQLQELPIPSHKGLWRCFTSGCNQRGQVVGWWDSNDGSSDFGVLLWINGVMYPVESLVDGFPDLIPSNRPVITESGVIILTIMLDETAESQMVALHPIDPPLSDFTLDCKVDTQDLLILFSNWGSQDNVFDLDGSGVADVGDLLVLLTEWTF